MVTSYTITNVLAGVCEGAHTILDIDVDTDIGPMRVMCSYGHSGKKPAVWECRFLDKAAPESTDSKKQDEEP